MNILTLCQRGNNRSVVLGSILRDKMKQKDVISAGAFTYSQETLVMLYDWADKILVVEKDLFHSVHPEYQDKVIIVDIGPDVWGYKPNPSLVNKATRLLQQIKL